MKRLILVLAFAMVFGCEPGFQGERPAPQYSVSRETFEGHQYLLFSWGHGGGPVHDPSCNHPRHRGRR